MMARTHLIGGAFAWVVVAHLSHIPIGIAPIALAMFGSLLPDIDHPKSTFGRKVPFISIPISLIFGHRGITHSLIAVVAIIALLFVSLSAGKAISASIAAGYLSHLLLDWFTPSGVPLLYPSMKRFSSPVTVRTGSIGEFIFTLTLTGVFLIVI